MKDRDIPYKKNLRLFICPRGS